MDVSESDYTWITIEGVKCFKTCFINNGEKISKKEKARRKKVKDELGETYKDTIILDSTGQDCFCDAIIYASNVDTWIQTFSDLYSTQDYVSPAPRSITGGKQHLWFKGDDLHIIINCYRSANKLMVQGNADSAEGDLLQWVADFAKVRHQIIETPGTSGFSDDAGKSKPSKRITRSIMAASNHDGAILDHIPAEKLTVKLPPSGKAAKTTATPPPPSDLPSTPPSTSTSYIQNELLCFLQNKLNGGMPVDTVHKLIVDFYKDDDIAEAKDLLFASAVTNVRYRRKIGPHRSKQNVTDMINVILELQPNSSPVFTASDLSNIPPVSMNNVDILKLLRELEGMKSSISALQYSHSEVIQAQEKVLQFLHNKPKPVDTGNLMDNSPVTSPEPVESEDDLHQDVTSNDEPLDTMEDTDLPAPSSVPAPVYKSRIYYSQALKQPPKSSDTNSSHTQGARNGRPARPAPRNTQTDHHSQTQANDVIIGKGHHSTIKAAAHRGDGSGTAHSFNKECIGIFVSRLDPRLSERRLQNYVFQMTGLRTNPEKLQTRYSSYSSFLIRGNKHMRSMLMDAEMWDNGTLVKPYFH